VSIECERQVDQVTGHRHPPFYQIRAQFRPEYFQQIPRHPPHDQRPFRIMYIGRIDKDKGLFDLLEMARELEARLPGDVRWEICGTGKDFEELKRRHQELGLGDVVTLRGWTSLPDLINVYARSHASIVPTRSAFIEGLPMTAAEAILAGRPVITNPVAPALEILGPAAVEAKTNDVQSYVEGIIKLASDPDYYNQLCEACPDLQKQFYDRNQGLAAVLKRALLPEQ
jgi:glycogen synthase